jgi:formate dehydrogenase subunit delta
MSAVDEAEPHVAHDTVRRLIYRANQMTWFFRGQGPEDEAAAAVASHIKRYWTRQMQEKIFRHLDGEGGEGLEPITLAAVRLLKETAGA